MVIVSNSDIKYTSLTVEDILQQVYDRFLKRPNGENNDKFDNFRESAIAQTLIEIFAGVTDINNYYIQRRAEECYFDTAQLKSSVISLSRMLGYVMNRKEPSRANLRMIIEGDIEDSQIQIPYYSKFSYDGNPYVLVNTMTYRIPTSVYNTMNDDTIITIDVDSFDNPIEIVQGSIKEKVFNGDTNSQVNAPFQIYKIEDQDFSNVYGERDFFFNDVTQVYVGDDKTEDTRFEIDRRSLLNWETINTSDLTQSKKVCVIRTSNDGNVELLFGDGDETTNTLSDPTATGGYARKGALTRKDNIYVQYLACEGKSTNKTGVIGEKVDFSGKVFNSNGKDITSKISFELLSNVYGGGDEESIDSIKYSAPKIYYSLDRLVTKDDYIAYLKSLNSPINVQNAVAWGEQEERDLAFKFALAKMFNVTLFTLTGSMYDLDQSPFKPKEGDKYDEVVLDLNYNPYEFQTQGYFNIYTIQEMVNQLNRYTQRTTFPALDSDNFTSDQATSNDRLNEIADNVKQTLSAQYPNGKANLNFKYASDDHKFSSNLTATGTVELSGLNDITSSGKDYMNDLAALINTALLDFKDLRGNKTDNQNFNKDAFIARGFNQPPSPNLFVWDTLDNDNNYTGEQLSGYSYRFRMRFNEGFEGTASPCYITEFVDDALSQLLGFTGENAKVYWVAEDQEGREENGKITSVVRDLNSRSQVNIKNIYVSPIIHRFNLVGDVYVKPLYDKEDVKVQVLDDLYSWLDVNADFNQPLYLSNIVEIFENNLGVVHANIRLEPELVDANGNILSEEQGRNRTTSDGQNYNPTYDNPIYRQYTIEDDPNTLVETEDSSGITRSVRDTNPMADPINDKLAEYLSATEANSTANEEWYRRLVATSRYGFSWSRTNFDGSGTGGGGESRTIRDLDYESYSYKLLNNISERTFYTDFAGPLYEYFRKQAETNPDPELKQQYRNFIGMPDSQDNSFRTDVLRSTVVRSEFAVIMEDIHKDLSYIIKENLLDSSGNIDVEYNDNGTFIRGGYTLGSEIVQVLGDAKYTKTDSNGDKVPFLNFRYK